MNMLGRGILEWGDTICLQPNVVSITRNVNCQRLDPDWMSSIPDGSVLDPKDRMLQGTQQNPERAAWCQPMVEFFLGEMMRFQTDSFGSRICESRMVTRELVLGRCGNLSLLLDR